MNCSSQNMIALIVAPILILACSHYDHLSFKGIPIDGSLDLFTKRMIKNGFTVSDSGPTVTHVKGKEIMTGQVYDGLFWSDDPSSDVQVTAFATDMTGTVFEVQAIFDRWDIVRYMFVEDFGAYAELLREKYGDPIIKQYGLDYDPDQLFWEEEDSEGEKISLSSAKSLSKDLENLGFFGTRNPYISQEAFERLAAEKSRCYVATYETKNGFIRLALYLELDAWDEDYNNFGLGLFYCDKKNLERCKKEIDRFHRLRKSRQIEDL